MKIALVIGHKKNSPGACNDSGICEHDYNSELVRLISNLLDENHINNVIVHRDTYLELPFEINKLKPDLVLSFHCNAFDGRASGSETLYYHRSKKGKELAIGLLKTISSALGLRYRGAKPKRAEERGGYLLKYTHAPCVILEPFFIDNDSDIAQGILRQDELARKLVKYIKSL
jgi:N-acetylmuramoyl-L-alanine amidase